MLNNKGMGRKETMVVLLMLIIFMTVLLYLVTRTHSSNKIRNFRREASDFISEAATLRDTEAAYENGTVYLYDSIKEGYTEKMISPFNVEESCDLYESRIYLNGNSKRFDFKCGEYMIYNQSPSETPYKIYKVSDWSDIEITGENVQKATFYNYEENGVEKFSKYYIEKQFLVEYGKENHTRISDVNYLNENHKILKKTYYRTIEEVK